MMNSIKNSFSSNIVVNQKSTNKLSSVIYEVLEENKYVIDMLKAENLNLKTMSKSQIQFLYSNLQPFLFQRSKISQCVERLDKIIQLTETKRTYLLSKLDIIIKKEKDSMGEIIKLFKNNSECFSDKRSSHQGSYCKKVSKRDSQMSRSKFNDISYATEDLCPNPFGELPQNELHKLNIPCSAKSNNSCSNQNKVVYSNLTKYKPSYIKKPKQRSEKSLLQSQTEQGDIKIRYRSNSVEVSRSDSRRNLPRSPTFLTEQDHLKRNSMFTNTNSVTKHVSFNSKKNDTMNEYWQGAISQSSNKNDSKSTSIYHSLSKNENSLKSKSSHRRSESVNAQNKSEMFLINKPTSLENLRERRTFKQPPQIVKQITDYYKIKTKVNPEDNNVNADLIQKILTKFDSVKQFIDKHKRLRNHSTSRSRNIDMPKQLNINIKASEETDVTFDKFKTNDDKSKEELDETHASTVTDIYCDVAIKPLSNQRLLKEQDIREWVRTNLEEQRRNNYQPVYPTKPVLRRSKSRDNFRKSSSTSVFDENIYSNLSVVNSSSNIILSNCSSQNQSIENLNTSFNSNMNNRERNSSCNDQHKIKIVKRANGCHDYVMA